MYEYACVESSKRCEQLVESGRKKHIESVLWWYKLHVYRWDFMFLIWWGSLGSLMAEASMTSHSTWPRVLLRRGLLRGLGPEYMIICHMERWNYDVSN